MLDDMKRRGLRPLRAGSTLTITDITERAARLEAYDGHERIWLGEDPARGLTAIVAIHDTTLGPALGGTRIWPHDGFDAALTDALRLSRGMTLKSAIAGVPFGGGKAVIHADPRTEKTEALLEAYAEMLASLDGQYFTGEDVGLTLADADFLRARTRNVTGTTVGGSGNPSPVTAHGVFLGIKAAFRHRFGSDALAGRTIAVQGLGSVGFALCEALHGEGAHLLVTDLDPDKVGRAQARFGAEAVDGAAIITSRADLLAPCALGSVISADIVAQMKVAIVAGAANNQLAGHDDARALMEAGILYAPDYVLNAGGLINVAAELDADGYDRAKTMAKVAHIPDVLTDIFQRSDAQGLPTNDIAEAIARERIEAARAAIGQG